MKKRDISYWEQNEYTSRLLLFAETLEEGAFHYSYESYKIPALNCHFLCYDVIRTARDIERKALMDGNFVPLSEEFEYTLRADYFIKYSIDDKGILLYNKDKNYNYFDLSSSDLRVKINRYSEVATFVKDVCETGNTYLNALLNIIIDNIFCDSNTYENNTLVYTMTRALMSDLVNSGYSKEYLYSTVIDYFFTSGNPVACNADTVIGFLTGLTSENTNTRLFSESTKKPLSCSKSLTILRCASPLCLRSGC